MLVEEAQAQELACTAAALEGHYLTSCPTDLPI